MADDAEVVKDWHLPSNRARKQQRWVKLTGTLASGTLDTSVFALYEPPAPAGLVDNPDRRAAGNAEITGVDDPDGARPRSPSARRSPQRAERSRSCPSR